MSESFYLSCPPTHFAVVDQDNAFQEEGMQQWLDKPDYWKKRILATHASVEAELFKRGGKRILIPADPSVPDQCFTADPILVAIRDDGSIRVFPSNMNSPTRQKEVDLAVAALKAHPFAWGPAHIEINYLKHEGTGDLLPLPGFDMFVQGYGPRSERTIGRTLSHILNQAVAEVPLVVANNNGATGLASSHTKGFHLDTLVWPLPNKYVMGCFENMHPSTRAFFENLYPEHRRIELTASEADFFITNGLAVPDKKYKQGHILFIPDTTPNRIQNKLQQWGFGTMGFDFEPSKLAGGGLHCMFNFVLKINGGQARAINQFDWPEGMPLLSPKVRADITCYSPRSNFDQNLV